MWTLVAVQHALRPQGYYRECWCTEHLAGCNSIVGNSRSLLGLVVAAGALGSSLVFPRDSKGCHKSYIFPHLFSAIHIIFPFLVFLMLNLFILSDPTSVWSAMFPLFVTVLVYILCLVPSSPRCILIETRPSYPEQSIPKSFFPTIHVGHLYLKQFKPSPKTYTPR